jgi:hypothetical protein
MKHLSVLVFTAVLLSACSKTEDRIPFQDINEEYLQSVIKDEGVDALEYCCSDCFCNQEIGVGTDFDFPGNNKVRIRQNVYDLDRVYSYRIETIKDDWTKECRMILYFE